MNQRKNSTTETITHVSHLDKKYYDVGHNEDAKLVDRWQNAENANLDKQREMKQQVWRFPERAGSLFFAAFASDITDILMIIVHDVNITASCRFTFVQPRSPTPFYPGRPLPPPADCIPRLLDTPKHPSEWSNGGEQTQVEEGQAAIAQNPEVPWAPAIAQNTSEWGTILHSRIEGSLRLGVYIQVFTLTFLGFNT